MTIVLADADYSALAAAEQSARALFPDAQIIPCQDAMSAFKYCTNHQESVALVIISIILRPVDGLQLSTMLMRLPLKGKIVLTFNDNSRDLCFLVNEKGIIWSIVKPVTPQKLAATVQDMIAKCDENATVCPSCPLDCCLQRTYQMEE